MGRCHTEEISKVIDDAMEAIEEENPKLKGVLPKNYASPNLDKDKLSDVVDLFTDEIHAEELAKSRIFSGAPMSTASRKLPKWKKGKRKSRPQNSVDACFFIACGYMLWPDQSRL